MNVIAIADVNNFYASCERLFDARLVGKPVIVLSNNDGCVIARSNEAKKCGVKMGVPLFQIRHLVDLYDIQIFSSNYTLYGDLSSRIMEVLGDFTPNLETYSIDEAFLDLSAVRARDLDAYGREIKRRVEREVGLPISLGIAATKTLAKIANFHAKRSPKARSVVTLNEDVLVDVALLRTPVAEVWGIGPAYARLLHAHDVATAWDLRLLDDAWVRRHLTVVGLRTVRELRGEACVPLETVLKPRQTLTVSRTFGGVVETLNGLQDAVQWYLTRAGEKLRRSGLSAGVVSVFVMTDRFRETEPQYANSATVELAMPTAATLELLGYARSAVERIYRPGYAYRRAGVTLGNLQPEGQLTLPLFDREAWLKGQALAKAVDEINGRWGRDAVRYGLTKEKAQKWPSRVARRSPRYTTCWPELFAVSSICSNVSGS